MILYLIVIIFLIIFLWCLFTNKHEGYGGPVKVIRRIPKNTCYALCESYYNQCVSDYARTQITGDDCRRRYDACVIECNYTDYQRL